VDADENVTADADENVTLPFGRENKRRESDVGE
jgi:hypothetical protein